MIPAVTFCNILNEIKNGQRIIKFDQEDLVLNESKKSNTMDWTPTK